MFKIFDSLKNILNNNKNISKKLRENYIKNNSQFPILNFQQFKAFDGEKNIKSLGMPLGYDIDYYGMANRAWNLYLTTDIAKIVIDRLSQFTIGDGLKLQYEPDKLILKRKYSINIDNEFQKYVESIWNIYCNSKYISNNNQHDIHSLSSIVMVNTLLCGDYLIIRRIKHGQITLQTIDGRNVCGGVPEHNSKDIYFICCNKYLLILIIQIILLVV